MVNNTVIPTEQLTETHKNVLISEKKHFYYTELASQYGIIEAVILTNIIFWIRKNIKNNKNYKNGYFWTFNSVSCFSELFPEFSDRQIQYYLEKLENGEVLVSDNFNKRKYDRTKWYRLGNKIQGYYFGFEPEYCKNKPIDKYLKLILQYCQMHLTKSLNGYTEIVEPIPYINTDNKHNIEKKMVPFHFDLDSIKSKWNDFAKNHNLSTIRELSNTRVQKLTARLNKNSFNFDEILKNVQRQSFLLGENKKNWKIDFDWIIENDNNYLKILEKKYNNLSYKEYYYIHDGDEYEVKDGCIELNGIRFSVDMEKCVLRE